VVTGTGNLDAGGAGGYCCNLNGSPGRIRIDCTDAYAFRSLQMNGVATRGSQMFVFPPGAPHLDIIQAAGQNIPAGTNNAVVVNLPAGRTNAQTVTIQASGFTNNVPINVSVVPENRYSSNYQATVFMTNDPAQVTVNVFIPDGTISRIFTWTR
jgi:hypothetical protein